MRRPLAAAAIALLLVGVGACTAKAGGRGGGPVEESDPQPIATASVGTGHLAVSPPPAGALIGAYVKPAPGDFTDPGKVRAVDAFESMLGRPMDIVHTYRTWTDEFFSPSDLEFIRRGQTLLASWGGTDTRVITSGRYDDLIRKNAQEIKDMGRPILLRFRWEMDRPNLRAEVWSSQDFVAAWKHIWTIFNEVGAENVSWVWCPTAKGFADNLAQAFYPGDQYVDWICITTYPPDVRKNALTPLSALVKPFLEWAAGHQKPIIIGEYGIPKILASTTRAAWLTDATTVWRSNPQIKAVIYFESDPGDRQESHHYELREDPVALDAFKAMVNDPYFNPDRRRLNASSGQGSTGQS